MSKLSAFAKEINSALTPLLTKRMTCKVSAVTTGIGYAYACKKESWNSVVCAVAIPNLYFGYILGDTAFNHVKYKLV
jgi:hypothetical protein